MAQRIMALGHIQGLDREVKMTSQSELWDAILPVVEALVALNVPYYASPFAPSISNCLYFKLPVESSA